MPNKSFTLIEVVIAIFLVTVGTVGAYSLIQRTIVFTSVSSSQFIASYLSQEGMEIVRNIRDSNWLEQRINPGLGWDDGLTLCSAGCEADYEDSALVPFANRFLRINGGFYNYSSGDETLYKRKIIITPQVNVLNVLVEVSWYERGRDHLITTETELHNWR